MLYFCTFLLQKETYFLAYYDAAFENGCIKRRNNEIAAYTPSGALNPLEKEEFFHFYDRGKPLENEIEYFCYCIQNGLKPKLRMQSDSVKTTVLNCAELESLNSGKAI